MTLEPRDTRTHAVGGTRDPVEILIDRWGVPHVYASSHQDVLFARGWNVARDRLWQIDLWRRRGLGLLYEVFGPSFVERDRAARLFLYRGDMREDQEDFRQTGGSSWRVVVDVGGWDNSLAINSPGQSGVPKDEHYDDLFPLWAADGSFPLLYSRERVEEATELRIVLRPEKERSGP